MARFQRSHTRRRCEIPQAVIAGALVVHGLITTSIGIGAVTNPNAPSMPLPAWFSWWPGPFGRSWVLDGLNLGAGAGIAGGLLWLAAGVTLIGAGLGWLGVPGLQGVWQTLAITGAAIGLGALALYFHPIYLGAILINAAVVVAMTGVLTPAR